MCQRGGKNTLVCVEERIMIICTIHQHRKLLRIGEQDISLVYRTHSEIVGKFAREVSVFTSVGGLLLRSHLVLLCRAYWYQDVAG